ncbi:MAG TPA: efflux RND transporter periplasmic adaptor subunit, partial [Bacteroidetes bacterium]|nr:efflux RND transporter periplasmic adaptor subunit [Bacteroidota bacterium]
KIAEQRVYHYNKEQAINVHTETLKLKDSEAKYTFTGTFEPDRETKINADMQGKIISIYVDQGSQVKRGQRLVKLDDALLQYQLQAINVQIEGLELDVKRYAILTDADAIQGVKLEKTELGLKAAKIQKSTLLEKISKTAVKAPFSGIVTMKMSEVGDFAAPGKPLMQLTNISKLRFTAMVPESQLHLFAVGQTYPIQADAYPELELSGKVIVVGSKGNPGRSFPIQVMVENTADLQIKSGMYGQLALGQSTTAKKIIIPSTAVVGSGIQPQVYLVQNGKAVLRDVTIGKRIQNEAVIESGLKAGDVIVTGGFINLFDGANVVTR